MTVQIALVFLSIALTISVGINIWLVRLVIENQPIEKPIIKKEMEVTPPALPNNEPLFKPKLKYTGSKLSAIDKDRYLEKLTNYLAEEKAYRDVDLTIGKLAKRINVPKHYVSQIINEKIGCSFLDYINQQRIAEAKELLSATNLNGATYIDIGKKVGFKAKSTFYAAFKKYNHHSPGDFRKNVLKLKNSE
ncbi:MAG: helix-turn-helix domain-containing protein [Bacteroidota bacterium]